MSVDAETADIVIDEKVKKLFESTGTKVLKFLGEGAYAKVYKVMFQGRIRACKVIQLRDSTRQYKFKLLPRELKILTDREVSI